MATLGGDPGGDAAAPLGSKAMKKLDQLLSKTCVLLASHP